MTQDRDFKRLSRRELDEELEALRERLSGTPDQSRVKNLIQNLRIHQVELEMQNRELRETQEALEESRDRYVDLYDFAPIGYVTLDVKGVVREINLTAARMLGRPRAELLDRPLAPRLEPGHGTAFFRHLNEVFNDPLRSAVEVALRARAGTSCWVMFESVRVLSEGKTVCRSAMLEVTERRRMEADLHRREQELRRVTDALPEVITYIDRDMRYRFVNASYYRWFDLQPRQVIGLRVDEVIDSQEAAALQPFVGLALRGEQTCFESTITHRDLGSRRVSVCLIPDVNEGVVNGFYSVTTDVTDCPGVPQNQQ